MIAKHNTQTGTSVRKLCIERLKDPDITEAQLTEALDPARITKLDAGMVGAG